MKKLLLIIFLILIFQSLVYANALKASSSDFLNINEIEFENTDMADKKNQTTVFLTHEFLEKDILKIQVNIKDALTPVIGAAFHLVFDTEKLEFLKYLPGDFLEKGGDPMYLITQKNQKIIFGETLTSKDNLPLGEGKFVEIYFKIKDLKPYSFSFENSVLSTMDTVMQDIEEVTFINYEISDTEKETSIQVQNDIIRFTDKLYDIFSLKNILISLIPSTAVFFTLWTLYIQKIKPHLKQN